MNIVVCVKEVPDINLPLSIDFDTGSVDFDDAVFIVNPPDRVAVEEAIRIKESQGEGKVTIISFGPKTAITSLRKCLAMGADEAILIDGESHAGLDTGAICTAIAGALRTLEYDLVLCGCKAKDMQLGGGQSGVRIAALLDLPFVTEVDSIEISKDGRKSRVHKRLERGNRYLVECPLPALFTVSENANKPRYPTVSSSLHALRSHINVFTVDFFGLTDHDFRTATKVLKITRPKPRQRKIFTPDASLSAEDRIKAMLGGGSKDKKSDILEGSPERLTESIIGFLRFLEVFDRRDLET